MWLSYKGVSVPVSGIRNWQKSINILPKLNAYALSPLNWLLDWALLSVTRLTLSLNSLDILFLLLTVTTSVWAQKLGSYLLHVLHKYISAQPGGGGATCGNESSFYSRSSPTLASHSAARVRTIYKPAQTSFSRMPNCFTLHFPFALKLLQLPDP